MHRSRAYIAFVLIILLSLTVSPLALGASRSDIDASLKRAQDARNAAEQAEEAAAQYGAEARALDETINEIHSEVKELDPRIEEASSRTARLQAELDELRTKIAEKEAELEKTTAEFERQQELLNARMTSSYKQGSAFYLDILFDSKTINDLIARTTLVQRVITANQDIAIQLADTTQRLANQKAELDRARDSVATKRTEAAVVENGLRDMRSKRQAALDREKAAKSEKTALMEASEADAERYRAQAEEEAASARQMEAELRASTSSGSGQYSGGVMAWPVPGGSITSPYGPRIHPIFKTSRFHHGVDFSAGNGAIVAAADGTVARAEYGWGGGYGNIVVIDHGDGLTTLYAHILAGGIKVSNGQHVTKGQEIAVVGSTGYSTGPHLHFEVRVNGATTDPMSYLR